MSQYDSSGRLVGIRRPVAEDYKEFAAMVHRSRELHHPWVQPPATPEDFATYLETRADPMNDGFLVCRVGTGAIVGVINLNCIVRGHFHSAYLGYYSSAPFARKGFMTEALGLVCRYAFDVLYLHRLEANIQPENAASIALARKCGFQKEGFSPKYLKIAGQWRDHERWALLAEE